MLLAVALFAVPSIIRAQDAATEERLNKLTGQIQDLIEAQASLTKRIEALAKELSEVQQAQQSKPTVEYAAASDVRELAEKLKVVDRKRQEDNDKILDELKKLGRTLSAGGGGRRPPTPTMNADEGAPKSPPTSGKGFEHEVKPGQTLSAIIQAYRDQKNIKLTLKQVLDANPGLVPEKMYPGQKIFIPIPE